MLWSHSRLTSTHKCFSRGLNELVHCYVSQTYFTMLRIFHMDFSSPNSLKLFYNYCTTIDNNRHLMSRLMCNKITAGPLREHGTVITNWECFRMRRATFQCFLFHKSWMHTLQKLTHQLELHSNNILHVATYRSTSAAKAKGECSLGTVFKKLNAHCTLCKKWHTNLNSFSCSPPSTSKATASCNADCSEQARVGSRQQVCFRSLRSWYS